MSAATILFTDIVSFSKKPTSEQKRLVESLTAEVVHEVRTLLNPPMENPSVIALPTGDGMALAFLHRSDHPWTRATIFVLILRLHEWAHKQSSPGNSVNLRIGVHVGAVELVTDINGQPNVCGDTINYTQRVMDAAGPKQTLFSEEAYREYIGSESPVVVSHPFTQEASAHFYGPIQVFCKTQFTNPCV